jgi:hypothetical protein
MVGPLAPDLSASLLQSLRLATAPTDIVAGLPPVAFFSKTNALVTDTAPGGIICGRILQPLEMGLVRTKVETHGLTPVAL